MSDRQIDIGDLVQVVRPTECCKNEESLGLISKVLGLRTGISVGSCIHCGGYRNRTTSIQFVEIEGAKYLMPLRRLKRIPPLSELESIKIDEPIKATV